MFIQAIRWMVGVVSIGMGQEHAQTDALADASLSTITSPPRRHKAATKLIHRHVFPTTSYAVPKVVVANVANQFTRQHNAYSHADLQRQLDSIHAASASEPIIENVYIRHRLRQPDGDAKPKQRCYRVNHINSS